MDEINKIRRMAGLPEILTEADNFGAIPSFWVVVNPSPVSTIIDIVWKTTPADFTRTAILGSDRNKEYLHRWYGDVAFYLNEAAAKGDAKSRLAARDAEKKDVKESYKNTYEVGDSVKTALGTGVVKSVVNDYCMVHPDAESQKKYDLEDRPYKMGFSEIQGHNKEDVVLSAKAKRLFADKEYMNDLADDSEKELSWFGTNPGKKHLNNIAATHEDEEVNESFSTFKKKMFAFWFGKTIKAVIEDVRHMNDKDLISVWGDGDYSTAGGEQLVQMKAIEKELKRRGIKDFPKLEEAKKEDDTGPSTKKKAKKEVKKEATPSATDKNTMSLLDLPTEWMAPDKEARKVDVPASVKKALQDQMKICSKHVEENQYDHPEEATKHTAVVDHLRTLLKHLEKGTCLDCKKAVIHYNEVMGDIRQKVPPEVVTFLTTGGKPSLKDYFNTAKAGK